MDGSSSSPDDTRLTSAIPPATDRRSLGPSQEGGAEAERAGAGGIPPLPLTRGTEAASPSPIPGQGDDRTHSTNRWGRLNTSQTTEGRLPYGHLEWSAIIHDISIVFPASRLDHISEWLDDKFGSERRDVQGQNFYTCGRSWPDGPRINHGGETQKGTAQLVVHGSVSDEMGQETLRALCELVYAKGGHATRIDPAVTYSGQEEGIRALKRDVDASRLHCCSHQHVTRPWIDENVSDGRQLSWSIRFGSRSSAVLVRVYDKGLEQGLDADLHLRVEAEFKADQAHQVCLAWLEAEHPAQFIRQAALGALAFHDAGSLGTRGPAQWQLTLLSGDIPFVSKSPKRKKSFLGFLSHAEKSVLKRVGSLCAHSGMEPREFVDRYFMELINPEKGPRDAIVRDFLHSARTLAE